MEESAIITMGEEEYHLESDIHNLLLRTPFDDEVDDTLCTELLTVKDPTRENVLSITLTQSPDDRLDTWTNHVERMPAETAIIAFEDGRRSLSPQRINGIEQDDPSRLTIENIADPSNLTRLGVSITDVLDQWSAPTNQTVICFHSLTALLQYCELDLAYRFLDTLTSHVKATDALAHYHIDPTANNQQAYSTIRLLFDAIIQTNDGNLTITKRR